MGNINKRERYIVLYAEDFDNDVWKDYCEGMGISPQISEVRINFDYDDVDIYEDEMFYEDTECRIRWVENGEEENVIIRSSEYEDDADDEEIFFYGMSRNDCIKAMESNELCQGEWRIVEVY